jgi:hypothetical protein
MDSWIEVVVWVIAIGLILPVLGMGAVLAWKAWNVTLAKKGDQDE